MEKIKEEELDKKLHSLFFVVRICSFLLILFFILGCILNPVVFSIPIITTGIIMWFHFINFFFFLLKYMLRGE